MIALECTAFPGYILMKVEKKYRSIFFQPNLHGI